MRVPLIVLLGAVAGCTIEPRPDSHPPEHRLNVFPLFYTERTGDTARSVIFPLLYIHHRDSEGVYTAIFPFFRYRRLGDVTDWHLLGGLAGYHHEPQLNFRMLNLPLIGWEKRRHERGFFIFPLVSTRIRRGDPEAPNFSRVSILGPLYNHYKRNDYYSLSMFLSLFQTAAGKDQGINVYELRLLPLFSYSRNWEPSGRKEGDIRFERRFNLAGPLLTVHEDNYGLGYRRVDFLWPFFRFTRGYPRSPRERETTFYVLPVFGWGKHWTYDATGKLERYRNEIYLLDPLLRYQKDSIDGVNLRILAGLFYLHRHPSGDRDFRILIRTIRVAKEGEKRVVNIWPFFGTEWDPTLSTRKTVILGGLFYYRRDPDGTRTKRIFWVIPIGRRRPAAKEEDKSLPTVRPVEAPVTEAESSVLDTESSVLDQ